MNQFTHKVLKERLYKNACATAAVADLIKNVDLEKLNECTMNNLSHVFTYISNETYLLYEYFESNKENKHA